MLTSDSRQRTLILLLLALMVAVVVGGFAYLVIQGRLNDRALILYNAGQAAASAAEVFALQGELTAADMPKGLNAFGVYGPDGEAIARYGTAPQSIPVDMLGNTESEMTSGESVRVVRPLGAPGFIAGRLMGGAGHSGMMRSSPGGTSLRQPMARGRGSLTLYAIYTAAGSLPAQRIRDAIFVGIAVLFGLLALAAYAFYRRLAHYREERANQRQMIELGEAARTLAHEIKNPLGAIRLQHGILLRTAPQELRGSVSIIGEEVARIASLTDRVREFLGNPVGHPQILDLCTFMSELGARQEYPVEVTTAQAPCLVRVDPDRMRSIATNLMNNAWESTHAQEAAIGQAEPPAVEVEVESVGRTVRLRVRDHGPGIAREILKRVFDPFFTTKERGTGVGLAITRRFVEGAGGTVFVTNRHGGGTDVVVELPRGNE